MKRNLTLKIFLTFLFAILFTGFLTYMTLEGKLETNITEIMVGAHFNNYKDLFDDYIVRFYLEDTKYITHRINYNNYFKLNFQEFSDLLFLTYDDVTSEVTNPCQFYSYIWVEYLQANNLDYRIVLIPGHTFVIAYLEDSYITLDQYEINQVYLN